jgi:hypothetical protein
MTMGATGTTSLPTRSVVPRCRTSACRGSSSSRVSAGGRLSAPNGKNACKVGPNDLTVIVKNGGKGDAASFAVRLSVGDDDLAQTVESLRGGAEREVSFENVQLKKASTPSRPSPTRSTSSPSPGMTTTA